MNILVRGHKETSATRFTEVMDRLCEMKVGVIYDDGSLGEIPRIFAFVRRLQHRQLPTHGESCVVDLVVEFK